MAEGRGEGGGAAPRRLLTINRQARRHCRFHRNVGDGEPFIPFPTSTVIPLRHAIVIT